MVGLRDLRYDRWDEMCVHYMLGRGAEVCVYIRYHLQVRHHAVDRISLFSDEILVLLRYFNYKCMIPVLGLPVFFSSTGTHHNFHWCEVWRLTVWSSYRSDKVQAEYDRHLWSLFCTLKKGIRGNTKTGLTRGTSLAWTKT